MGLGFRSLESCAGYRFVFGEVFFQAAEGEGESVRFGGDVFTAWNDNLSAFEESSRVVRALGALYVAERWCDGV